MGLADFRMGINPGPPIMSREEFETRKADLWRKRATESVAAKAPAPAATAEKVLKKTNAKGSVQKGKILEVVKEVPLDPMAEKLRQERGTGHGGYVPNKLAATSFASTSIQSIPSFTSKFVPPTTSASTSAAASASTSMHEVTSQASYLDTSSTDCCIADTTEHKKGRGKSRSLALLKIKSQGKRLDVEICRITGNPLGPWSDKFTTKLGIVTRQFAPQNVPKWSFISPEDKETLIAYLREGFIFSNEPYAIASILGMMKLRYKTYRFNLRQHFRSFPTMESALANPHEDIEKEVWRYLCQLWNDKTYQVIVEHTCNALAHTCGEAAARVGCLYWAADDATAAAVAEAAAMHVAAAVTKHLGTWTRFLLNIFLHFMQEKCQKNKENRFELKVLHTAGSKAFRKVQYDKDTNYKGFDSETRMERSLDLLICITRHTLVRKGKHGSIMKLKLDIKKLKERENEAIEDGSEQRRINEELNARVHNLESNSVEVNAKLDLGCPKGVTPKYSLKPLVSSLSDIKPDIDVEKMLF
ncbi:unnamed protein product [Camellia sinensis]